MVFSGSMLFAFLFFRFIVIVKGGSVSLLRAATGLNVHHRHYGAVLLIAACVLLIFYGVSWLAVILAGFSTGTVLDSFISSLLYSNSRAMEIANYDSVLAPTLLLLLGVVVLVFVDKVQLSKFNLTMFFM